jgi:hypothetical protein
VELDKVSFFKTYMYIRVHLTNLRTHTIHISTYEKIGQIDLELAVVATKVEIAIVVIEILLNY